MFPGSPTAQNFSLGADKLRYVMVHGITPYCYEMLKKEVDASDFYTVMFDESLNSVTQSSQMDILVRFWDNTTNTAKIRFWKTTYLGHATHKDLHDGFTKATADLDISKVVQLSMDGPNVNWKFAECLFRDRNEIGLSDLINFGSCSLHIVNGAFQTGATATAWDLKKILKATWQILHDSPARRDDFVSETDADVYPLPFCGTRWVENKQVADGAFLVWSNLIKITKFWVELIKYKQPKCKSFTVLTDPVFDLFMPAKLQFFSYVAGLLEPYLKRYQSDAPLVPFMFLI